MNTQTNATGAALRGDRNQCPGCSKLFNSSAAFDKHRTGAHKNGQRRCLTTYEMAAAGMQINASGYWIGTPMAKTYLIGLEK